MKARQLLLGTVAALMLAISPATIAHASTLTGETLALACAGNVPGLKVPKKDAKYVELCNTYINAFDDTVHAFLPKDKAFCTHGTTMKETSVVFFDYVTRHKEVEQLPAAEALMIALKSTWPCE